VNWLLVSAALLWPVYGCSQGMSPGSTPTETGTALSARPTTSLESEPTVVPTPTGTTVPARRGQRLLGESWEGRPIIGHWFGIGEQKVVLVGNIHGGTEENTYRLALELISYFDEHSDEVPSGVRLWIIPTANPDGLANGTRRNARGVDLNRNADNDRDSCERNDWVSDTYTTEGVVEGGGGSFPFSEVEARVLRDFLADAQIALFYHSMAGMIFATSCADHPPSAELAHRLSDATGYPFVEEGWASYPVTGAMVDYLAYQGVAAVEVELTGKFDPEFERNLLGVREVMRSVDEIVSSR
jgi:predicted deacylase